MEPRQRGELAGPSGKRKGWGGTLASQFVLSATLAGWQKHRVDDVDDAIRRRNIRGHDRRA